MFRRQRRPAAVVDYERFPWLAGALQIADKIMEIHQALIEFEGSWSFAARSRTEAALNAALAQDEARDALDVECLVLMKAWSDEWFPDADLRGSLRFTAVYGAITAMHLGVTLEEEVFSRQLQLREPRDQQWLAARHGQGLSVTAAARQHLDEVVQHGVNDYTSLRRCIAEASNLFNQGKRVMDDICKRYPELFPE